MRYTIRTRPFLLRLAKQNGAKAIGGMRMLVGQAAAAQEIWYNASFRDADIDALCRDAVKEMGGFFNETEAEEYHPMRVYGQWKTTVGRRLAQKTHMEFLDMDHYIEEREGRTIADIFAQDGEETFRRMETEAARELASRRGLIIASGGGTLLRLQNVKIFRKSGVTVLLDTPIGLIQERLKNDTVRPLLQKAEPEESDL